MAYVRDLWTVVAPWGDECGQLGGGKAGVGKRCG